MELALEAKNITKHYTKHTALDDVSIQIPKGCILGLLGPNGAGKTTFIRIVNQIINPDLGAIRIFGESLAPKHIEWIGYLPEERGLYKKMKVGDQLLFLARLKGLPSKEAKVKIKYWMERFEVQGWWHKKVEDLSKGMAQKIQFISTVMHDPKLIILDEPFSGFDPINANLIRDEILRLRDNGATILFSTHRMESVEELCDQIVLIHQSKIMLEGEKTEIKSRYRSHTYVIESTDKISKLPGGFEIIKEVPLNGIAQFETHIKGGEGVSTNEVLQTIIKETEVISFREKLPTINDIFISIAGTNHE